MGLKRRTVILAVCDRCGPDWWIHHPDLDAAPQFPSIADAVQQLTAYLGWRVTASTNRASRWTGLDVLLTWRPLRRLPVAGRRLARLSGGHVQMRCGQCAALADCAEHGHRWNRLDPPADPPNAIAHLTGDLYKCQRCGNVQHACVPPGHPESLSGQLTADQEAFLAALDAQLFGGGLSTGEAD